MAKKTKEILENKITLLEYRLKNIREGYDQCVIRMNEIDSVGKHAYAFGFLQGTILRNTTDYE